MAKIENFQKGIERVEDGVGGRQTKGVDAMKDGAECCQARENELDRLSRKPSGKVSEKMEDGGERRQARGGVETKQAGFDR